MKKPLLIDILIGLYQKRGPKPRPDLFQLKVVLDALRPWKSITDGVAEMDLLSRAATKGFNDASDVGNRFCRGTEKGEQTFPWVLPNQSQPMTAPNGLVNGWVPIDLSQDGFPILFQPKKMYQKLPVNPFEKKTASSLAERKDPIGGLNKIGIHYFGVAKELATFQCILKGEMMNLQLFDHSFTSLGRQLTNGSYCFPVPSAPPVALFCDFLTN